MKKGESTIWQTKTSKVKKITKKRVTDEEIKKSVDEGFRAFWARRNVGMYNDGGLHARHR